MMLAFAAWATHCHAEFKKSLDKSVQRIYISFQLFLSIRSHNQR